MGSLFSKRKVKSMKKHPRIASSTQSLTTDYGGTSFSLNPHADCQPGVTQSLTNLHSPEVQPYSSVQPQNVRQKDNSIENQYNTRVHARMSPPPPSSAGEYLLPNSPIYSQPEDAQRPKVKTHSHDQTQTKLSPVLERHPANKTQPQPNVYAGIDPPERVNTYPGPQKETAHQGKTVPDPEQVVGEDSNYKSEKVKMGDILQVIGDREGNGGLYAKNLVTGKVVLVATNCEPVITSDDMESEKERDRSFCAQSIVIGEVGLVATNCESVITNNDVESQKCFFKGMDRDAAEAKLRAPDIEPGTYLLRPSTEGAYALSLRCETELYELDVKHYKVRVTDKGICYIDFDVDSNTKPFGNIVELIKHYEDNSVLRCKLTKPLLRDDPLVGLAVKSSDMELGEKLGSGNFATVFAGTLHGNKQVAVKSLKNGGSMTVDEFRMEAETMHKLRHPNLVSLLAISEESGKINIIMEMMSKGALVNLLRDDDDHTIGLRDLMDIAIQVTEGMCFLESKSFVHRDLRAANVLLGDDNVTKIADFGLTRLLDNYYEHEDYYQNKKGSVFPYKWTSPEAVNKQKFTVKSDVWSFGILLYEMVTYGKEPYVAMSNRESLVWVEKGNRLERPTDYHCPLALYNIMKQCWLINPSERPHFKDIKENLVEIKTNA